VAGWARRGEVDVIEVPDWQGWAAGWPRLPVPVIARLNGSGTYFAGERGETPDRLTRWLEAKSLRRADFVCSASRYTADRTWQLFDLPAPGPTILHNPVEPGTRPNGVPRGHRVVFSGTLTHKKGVVSLIKAWPQVVAQVPAAELHLFGKDAGDREGASMESHLRSLLPAPCRPSVRFHGHINRDDLLAALSTARAAVFPSYAEAFALAPLEAMACGCPTIYSKRGSGPELIRDGADGLLVDPDRPEEIAGAIVRILCDDQLAQQLGAAGPRRVAEAFSLEALVERNASFYSQCVGAFRPTPRQVAHE
jgi:glycosyltransferase involved in cell wall biosynthesis